jgi:hypothetical protein
MAAASNFFWCEYMVTYTKIEAKSVNLLTGKAEDNAVLSGKINIP